MHVITASPQESEDARAAKAVLAAIIRGDFDDTRIENAGRGLRFLRECGAISERPGWMNKPLLINPYGHGLAASWQIT